MYIDENRPNIFVINSGEVKIAHHEPQLRYQEGPKTIQSPIVIANPLPPFNKIEEAAVKVENIPQSFLENGYGTLEEVHPPTKRPPSFTPTPKKVGTFDGDGTSLKSCLFHYGYIFLKEEHPGYWFYLTYVNKEHIAGYMWTGYRYVYKIVDTKTIQIYQCY